MAHYRKIDTRTLNDSMFNKLTDDGKLIFYILLTHPHLTSLGAMRITIPGLASEIGWPTKKLRNALNEELLKKMVRYDETAAFMWMPNFLKYNRPESPNVIRSWAHAIDYLPECALKNELIEHAKNFVAHMSEGFQEALPEVFRKSMPNQEQEHKQEQEQEKIFMSSKSKSHEVFKSQAIEVLNFLNEKTGRLYRPVDINLKLIIARLKSGASVMDCRQVIAKKTREWKGNEKMVEYLRPATLFNATKFEQYMGELVIPKAEDELYELS